MSGLIPSVPGRPAGVVEVLGARGPDPVELYFRAGLINARTLKAFDGRFMAVGTAAAQVATDAAAIADAATEQSILATFDANVAAVLAGQKAAQADIAALNADKVGDLRTFMTRNGGETGSGGQVRFRVGNRLYGTFDRLGFHFLRAQLGVGVTADDKPALRIVDRLLAAPVGQLIRGAPDLGVAARWRIGNRLFMSIDPVNGVWPRKLTVPYAAKVEDDLSIPLAERLMGRNAGRYFKGKTAEFGTFGHRWRIGNRLYATLDIGRGFYPRKATLPANTRVDDDLAADLSGRLVGSGIGANFRRLPQEAGTAIRFRLGNRLIGSYSKATGIAFTRQMLPADTKMADQPGVTLADRLGGSGRVAAASAAFVAIAAPDSAGKSQITTRRRSDGKRFQLTTNPTNYRNPAVTTDDFVLFDSEADARLMYAPAVGGVLWPVDPYDIIEAWGDSLTAGAGSAGSGAGQGGWPKQLKDRMGSAVSAVNNRGVGGQLALEIAARQGGRPVLLTLPGNQIPASGAVAIPASGYSTDLLWGSIASITGTLAGVPCTLSDNGDTGASHATQTYTLTRTTPGAAVDVPPGTPFIPDLGVAALPRVQIFTYGRNDGATPANLANRTLPALAASSAYQAAYVPRFLVGGLLVAVNESAGSLNPADTRAQFDAANAAIAAAYPGRFVNLNAVPTTEEMALIGFTPAGPYSNGRTDAQDLAEGYIPSGMRAGSTDGVGTDYLHLNNFGYALWALRYYRAIVAMGWWPSLPTV